MSRKNRKRNFTIVALIFAAIYGLTMLIYPLIARHRTLSGDHPRPAKMVNYGSRP